VCQWQQQHGVCGGRELGRILDMICVMHKNNVCDIYIYMMYVKQWSSPSFETSGLGGGGAGGRGGSQQLWRRALLLPGRQWGGLGEEVWGQGFGVGGRLTVNGLVLVGG
jgi:hypothetical protein